MKNFLLLFIICFLASCTGVGTSTIKQQQEDSLPVTETPNAVTDCKIVNLVDSIITADPNAFNNRMTTNKTEERVTKELKRIIPSRANIISDVRLTCSEVLTDVAHFDANLQLTSNSLWKIDLGIAISLPENELAKFVEGKEYIVKDCSFKELWMPEYSMTFSKDPLEGADNRKICVWYEIKDAQIEPAN